MFEIMNPDEAPPPSQREFAVTLVERMGLEEALQICRDNSWYSIWEILRNEEIPPAS